MARRPAPSQPTRATLTSDEKRQAISRFNKLLTRLAAFDPEVVQDISDPKITELAVAARSALQRTYAPGTIEHNQYAALASLEACLPYNVYESPSVYEVRQALRSGVADCEILVRQAIEDLQEDLDEQSVIAIQPVATPVKRRAAFIVHGHDEGPREAVARYVQRLDIEPIILHEQPNRGRTIIEKFEEHRDVGFAVVLLTPDDVGGVSESDLKPRARQNVILELGYFIGHLGRDRVCALKKGELEQPSDIVGVVYIDYDDAGAWRQKLAQEIQAAGFEIDWNRVMKN